MFYIKNIKDEVTEKLADTSREELIDMLILSETMIYNLIEDLKETDKNIKLSNKKLYNRYLFHASKMSKISIK